MSINPTRWKSGYCGNSTLYHPQNILSYHLIVPLSLFFHFLSHPPFSLSIGRKDEKRRNNTAPLSSHAFLSLNPILQLHQPREHVVFGNNAIDEHAAAANNATPLPTAAATSSLQMQKRKKGILQIRLHTVCSFVCSCNFLDVSLIHSVSISWKSSELSYTLSLLLWPWLRSLNSLSGQGCKDYSSHICKHCPTSNLAILGQLQICVWQNRKS